MACYNVNALHCRARRVVNNGALYGGTMFPAFAASAYLCNVFLGVVDGVIDLLKSAASLLSVATKLAQAIKALIKLFV